MLKPISSVLILHLSLAEHCYVWDNDNNFQPNAEVELDSVHHLSLLSRPLLGLFDH